MGGAAAATAADAVAAALCSCTDPLADVPALFVVGGALIVALLKFYEMTHKNTTKLIDWLPKICLFSCKLALR